MSISHDVMGDWSDRAQELTEKATFMGIAERVNSVVVLSDMALIKARYDTMAEFDISEESEIKTIIGRSFDALARYRERYGRDPASTSLKRWLPVLVFYQEKLQEHGWKPPQLRL